ncbi:dynein axonemal intermediate chain 4 isoform X3 [Cynoglossus semilaevis]|uniref:dynein axonemal intermediate chain 4 isoform X3 n=2 Tax=Cynoglossus semilaevis TaxID=244447 RepID=UPI000D62F290|nr:WD repeat-containing protein 78 isoform X3 [Cynoglossus semilaevis]
MNVNKSRMSERRALLLRPSSRAVTLSKSRGMKESSSGSRHTHATTRSQTQSVVDLSSRRRFSLTAASKVLEKKQLESEPELRVFDEEGHDVTPRPLLQADPGAAQARSCRFYMEEVSAAPGSVSEQTAASGSLTVPFSRSVLGSSRISSQSTIESVNEEIEETFSRRDVIITVPDVQVKRDTGDKHVTEDMLKDIIDVFVCETDTISLLDQPCTAVSADADDAAAVMDRNKRYSEVCRNRMGSDKFLERSVQTLSGALKNKHVQSDAVITVDAAAAVTAWDMYDSLNASDREEAEPSSDAETSKCPDSAVDGSRGVDRSASMVSMASTASASSSLKDVDVCSSVKTESDLQLIMQSDRFHHSLLVMERSIMGNTFQPLLAAYRQLPVVADQQPGTMELKEDEEDTDSRPSPALQHLWAFSCELTRGRRVSCMAWNKKNQDILAVGYGELDSTGVEPGLICCWSLKNPTWPERVVHCHRAVTALDFSAHCPGQLAVGMSDGTIAVYNVQNLQNQESGVISSSECPNKHSGPVWQLRWTQQELSFTGEDKQEVLVSASADGRISRWFVFNNGLDCIDLMKLQKVNNVKKKTGGKKTESVLSPLTPALCFDFHPTDTGLYLAGTWDGLVHKCSCSNTQQVLETFRKHFCPVTCVSWCPLSPDVFLSCSSDWTIQLWQQDQLRPVISFTSAQRAVCDVQWSPRWAAVFGAVNEGQLEIWDLNWSTLDPIIVQPAAPGGTMTSLLFTPQSHCVLVGDGQGRVTVYLVENLNVGGGDQVDVLRDIVSSAASSQVAHHIW